MMTQRDLVLSARGALTEMAKLLTSPIEDRFKHAQDVFRLIGQLEGYLGGLEVAAAPTSALPPIQPPPMEEERKNVWTVTETTDSTNPAQRTWNGIPIAEQSPDGSKMELL